MCWEILNLTTTDYRQHPHPSPIHKIELSLHSLLISFVNWNANTISGGNVFINSWTSKTVISKLHDLGLGSYTMCTVKQFKHKMKCCYIKYTNHIFQFNVYIPARADIRVTSFTALPSIPCYDLFINLSVSSAVTTCNLNSKESHRGLIQHLFTVLFVSQATVKGMWVRFLIGIPCLKQWCDMIFCKGTYQELHVSYSLEAWNDMEYHHDTFKENPDYFLTLR
jgi:hypothetical protein